MNEWWYNDKTGKLHQQTSLFIGPQGKEWHGPYATQEAAMAFYEANKAAHPEWKSPVPPDTTIPDAVGGAIDKINPFSNANLQAWLIRIGEILLGIVLIGVGLAKLTGTTNAIAGIVKARIP
jgi:hypothetical protein